MLYQDQNEQPGLEVYRSDEGLHTVYPTATEKIPYIDTNYRVPKTDGEGIGDRVKDPHKSQQNPFGLRPLWFGTLIATVTAITVAAVVGGAVGGAMAGSSAKRSSL